MISLLSDQAAVQLPPSSLCYTQSVPCCQLYDFVHVLSFDFTKAFEPGRHATLMSKMAQLQIPHSVCNWTSFWTTVINNNNNNNNHDNVYGAVIMAEPLREFTRFI